MPIGYWPVIVTVKDLGGDLGVHYDEAGQPHAYVEWSDSWSISASHECLEMLVDPWGNRLCTAHSRDVVDEQVQYLVEVCDPCQDARFGRVGVLG